MGIKNSKGVLFIILILLELLSILPIRAEEIAETGMEKTQTTNGEESLNFNDRLSKMESESRQQKEEIYSLKSVVGEDRKAIAHLTSALHNKDKEFNQLKRRMDLLEATFTEHSTIIDKVH